MDRIKTTLNQKFIVTPCLKTYIESVRFLPVLSKFELSSSKINACKAANRPDGNGLVFTSAYLICATLENLISSLFHSSLNVCVKSPNTSSRSFFNKICNNLFNRDQLFH